MSKHIIWTSDIDMKDWADYIAEQEKERGPMTDDQKYDDVHELNDQYLDDERMNCDLPLRVIKIADLGMWDGRYCGSGIVKNLADILASECDYCTWYFDGKDVRGELTHHDGTHYVLYRAVKDGVDIEAFQKKIYDNAYAPRYTTGDFEKDLARYTRSLAKEMNDIYGWQEEAVE